LYQKTFYKSNKTSWTNMAILSSTYVLNELVNLNKAFVFNQSRMFFGTRT